MRYVALVALILGVSVACSDGGSDGAQAGGRAEMERREDDLRSAAVGAIESFIEGDADAFYGHFSESFHDRCDRNDFDAILAFARVFIGDLSEREHHVEVTDVSFDDDRASVQLKVDIEGVDFDDDDEGSFSDFWVLENGEWKADTDEPKPCDLGDGVFGSSTPESDDDDDVQTGPGRTRSEALQIGETVTAGDLRVTVLRVDLDAANEIMAEDDFVEPPADGNRYVLISLRVEHAGEGEDTLSVSTGDFKLTGSRNVVYNNFDHDCGFFSSSIDGEMFPGGTLEGDVCFEVPSDESGLILIAQPFLSFDDGDKRYLALE